ncbi:acetate/propionate family kinase [Peterkaempfera bronchialis]|uniref:acetate/propionate family kinase n=1 Tax=Peterkaempfera bronchialis TaxID=2126346 RepID=UPI003C2C60CA
MEPTRRPADGAVLVLDAGSSSLHLTVYRPDGTVAARHDTDRPPGPETADELRALLARSPAVTAAGHRIVHGGPQLHAHTRVDDRVRAELAEAADLAPLHLPPALAVLDTARRLLPDIPHVACFDTVFHTGLPPAAREYAVPETWRARYGVRRYGFHGLSYSWALARTAELLGRPAARLRLVMAHLGGGCSATAVRDGRSVDTTMGFTPLEGLVMSHRSGTVDPGALTWLQTRHGLTAAELDDALNLRSGLLALSGTSDDTRDLVRARTAGDPRAALALDVFTHHCRRGIAAVAASLDRLDALVFTGEIGEDQPEVREEVCAGLPLLGLRGGLAVPSPDTLLRTAAVAVSAAGAAVPVVVVPTGETRQVAAETRAVLRRQAAPA